MPRHRQVHALLRWAFAVAIGVVTTCAASAARAGEADRLEWRGTVATVEVNDDAARRSYAFRAVTASGAPHERVVAERADGARLRTARPLFDGLYALALVEVDEDSVDEIRDGQFNDGQPIPCRCFETGAKWPYVWTRDISYSVDLALGALDPRRSLASLMFKQSPLRVESPSGHAPGVGVVAQDTGSGGSWPVSTDRVVWIHAATDVVDALGPTDPGLRARVLQIAVDTLDEDRRYAYDATSGLYRGETSFLDWREQTYPAWTRDDTRFIAEGFSLSTNVLHYIALRDAQRLAGNAQADLAHRLASEAAALKDAINQRFWSARDGLYSSYLSRDLAPTYAFDLLGTALAVTHGVASPERGRAVLARYPLTPAGPPVVWPEQPGVPIYHNRGLWPFVTAYALRAAAQVRDPAHMNAYAESIVRGAALSLSNYENFEFLTQATRFEDGALSGPVINSPRQLWSVAAYVGMVVHDWFGLRGGDGGTVLVLPSLPGALARQMFGTASTIALTHTPFAGRRIDVVLERPARWTDSDLLEAQALSFDGGTFGPVRPLPAAATRVRVKLRAVAATALPMEVVDAADPTMLTEPERRAMFAPPSPDLVPTIDSAGQASFTADGIIDGNRWQLYRDGVELATAARGERVHAPVVPGRSTCFSASQSWPGNGHRSLPSREFCTGGPPRSYVAGETLRAADGSGTSVMNDAPSFTEWGAPLQRLEFADIAPADGRQRLVIRYSNAYGPINTGITAAVKTVTARCPSHPKPQSGTIVMPHLAGPKTIDVSTAFSYDARRGERCAIEIADAMNMSYLAHFALYTAGRGGRSGPWNRAHIYAAEVVSVEPVRTGP